MLQPPIASFCPGVTNKLNLTLPSELGFHEASLILTSFSYVEPPPFSRCKSNGLSGFMYQTKPPGLVGNKNETPSNPTLLPTSRMSVALVLVTSAPKTFPTFIKGVNVIAQPAAQISLRNSRREIFPATNQELVTILLNNITIEAWINGIYIFIRSMEFVAFTKNNYVFIWNSGYVGMFEEGFFRDKTGHVVAFVGNARGDASAHAT